MGAMGGGASTIRYRGPACALAKYAVRGTVSAPRGIGFRGREALVPETIPAGALLRTRLSGRSSGA